MVTPEALGPYYLTKNKQNIRYLVSNLKIHSLPEEVLSSFVENVILFESTYSTSTKCSKRHLWESSLGKT